MEDKDVLIHITDRDGVSHQVKAPTDMNLNLMEVIRLYELAGPLQSRAVPYDAETGLDALQVHAMYPTSWASNSEINSPRKVTAMHLVI